MQDPMHVFAASIEHVGNGDPFLISSILRLITEDPESAIRVREFSNLRYWLLLAIRLFD